VKTRDTKGREGSGSLRDSLDCAPEQTNPVLNILNRKAASRQPLRVRQLNFAQATACAFRFLRRAALDFIALTNQSVPLFASEGAYFLPVSCPSTNVHRQRHLSYVAQSRNFPLGGSMFLARAYKSRAAHIRLSSYDLKLRPFCHMNKA
jgi:hypothetical protein